MSDEDPSEAALQEEIAELEAFEAQFKAADFAGVAEALRLAPEPETLSCLRRWLLPEFRFFIACCPGVQLSRDERIRGCKPCTTPRPLSSLQSDQAEPGHSYRGNF
jgi:hypothetical protein